MDNDSVIAIDLTKSMDAGILVRDYRPTLIMRKGTTQDGLQKISEVQVFPHSLTHIDLPNRLDSPDKAVDDRTTFDPSVYSPCTYPCIIVSLHRYANYMRTVCSSQDRWLDGKPQSPYSFWSKEEVFLDLLLKLKITREDLEKMSLPKRHFILFYTGWSEFAPADGDLTHSYWYPWHPYLMNPYLDEEAAKFLVDKDDGLDCSGIGVDISSLDSPLRNITEPDARPPKTVTPINDWEVIMETAKVSENKQLSNKKRFFVVHTQVLSRKKILLENAHIPAMTIARRTNEDKMPQQDSNRPFPIRRGYGSLALTPFSCDHPHSNCLLTAAAFVQKENI